MMNYFKSIKLKLLQINNKINNKQEKIEIIKSKSSLHDSFSFVLILAQCFALMPVLNVSSPNVNNIKFKWLSWRMFYSVLNLTGALFSVIFNMRYYASNGMHFGDLVTVIYYSITCLTIALFMRIGYKWHDLSRKWLLMEVTMKDYEYQPNLFRRFRITTSIVMFLALGEHLLFITKLITLLSECELFHLDPIKTYFGAAFSQTFSLTSYAHWKSFILEYFNILATFAWNFMDLFIMLICAAMAERFKQMNIKVKNSKIHNELFWKEIREDYSRLSVLCKSVDDIINNLVFLSFFNNLFFICIQLFRTLEPMTGAIINTIYFFGSFGFLLGRTAAVSMYAAWINDESKGFLEELFNVPSEYYGTEANRLIHQISSCPIAITGSNFFEINRDLCVKVAGAVITFELILQQIGPMLLNTDDKTGDKPFCL